MMREIEVFGKRILVERTPTGWQAYLPGNDGKRSAVSSALIPQFVVTDEDLLQYLADLWHEDAGPDRQTVRWVR